MSTGTIWPGAPYADGAKPTTAENPLRPASAPPVSRGKCTRPIPDGLGPNPDGPAVALSPRFDAGTAPVAGKPWTGPPAEKRSSGDPLGPIQPPLVFAASPPIQPPLILGPSPQRRARSTGPPPVPCTPAANDLEARGRKHAWLQALQTPPVKCARPPQNEQASSSGNGLRVPSPPQGPPPLAPPVPARAPSEERLRSGEPLPSGDPLPASTRATRKNCGGFEWQPKEENGDAAVDIASSTSSPSPPRRPQSKPDWRAMRVEGHHTRSKQRSRTRPKSKPRRSTQEELPTIDETPQEEQRTPVMGMHPTDEFVAWHAQWRSATTWEHAAESWASAQEGEPHWGLWAPAADHCPREWEPDWGKDWEAQSTQEHDWNAEWQPAAESTDATPPAANHMIWVSSFYPTDARDEAYKVWPDEDTRTPNRLPDGSRKKRARGGANERSHNGWYRTPRN